MHPEPPRRRRFARGAVLVAIAALGTVTTGPITLAAADAAAPPTVSNWAPLTPLDGTENRGSGPVGALSETGEATVVWQSFDQREGQRIFASTHAPGRAWSPATPISASGDYASGLQLAGNRRGDSVAIWSQQDGIFTAYRPAGGTWTSPERLAVELGNRKEIVIDETGAVTATWDDRAGGPGVHVARRTNGTWKALETPIDATHNGALPAIALDGAGTPTVAWRQTGGIRSRTLTGAGTWGPEQTIATATTLDEVLAIQDLQLAIDGSGNAVAGWDAEGAGGYDHRIVKIATRPTGANWQGDSSFSPAQSGSNQLEDLAVSPQGELAVATTRATGVDGLPSDAVITTKAPGQDWTAPRALEPGRIFNSFSIAFNAGGVLTAAWVSSDPVVDRGGTPLSARRSATGVWSEAQAMGPAGSAYVATSLSVDDAGNTLATLDGGLLQHAVHAAIYDVIAPTIDRIDAPTSASTGVAVNLAVAVTDVWSTPQVTWTFGDGTTATGASVSHAFARPGTFDVQVSAVDASGNTTTARRTISVATVPVPTAVPKPTPSPRPAYVPASLKGKVLTLGALVKPKAGKTCPKPSAVTVTAETRTKLPKGKGKKARTKVSFFKVKQTSLAVAEVDGACKISGTVTLRTAPSKRQAVLVRITAKSLRGGAAIEATRP